MTIEQRVHRNNLHDIDDDGHINADDDGHINAALFTRKNHYVMYKQLLMSRNHAHPTQSEWEPTG